ncbi:tail fiber assembly protein [Ramlibacter sp. AN1015]|uniref:tail fiber assembly protein n=1 Tax=Ramlibacter sp. AN1015 TaxID=3133428 RepID=UPI0030C55C96
MKVALYETETGRIVQLMKVNGLDEVPPIPGTSAIEVAEEVADDKHYYEAGEFKPFPIRSNPKHEWDWPTKKWVERRTAQQIQNEAWAEVRAERDKRLGATDWRVIRSTETAQPLSQAWRQYRQALRDITAQADPHHINWPTPPGE